MMPEAVSSSPKGLVEMNCASCGRRNGEDGRFCTACGSCLLENGLVAHLTWGEGTAQKEYLISDKMRCLGRDAEADVILEDDQVSSLHVRIVPNGGSFKIEDLGSRNGTYVNGERFTDQGALENGDLIKIGRTIIKFMVSS